MKRMKVSMKLLLPHIIVLLVLVAGIIISIVSLKNINEQVRSLYDESFVVKGAADIVNRTLEELQTSAFRAVSNHSQDITDEAVADTKNGIKTIQEQIALIKQNTLGNAAILASLEECVSQLTPMQEQVLTLTAQDKNAEAAGYMESTSLPVIKEAQDVLAELIQSADAKETEWMASLQQTQKSTIILLISLAAVAVLFSIGIGVRLAASREREAEHSANA